MNALTRATYGITQDDLELLAMSKNQLPEGVKSLQLLREGVLDNKLMATEGILEETAGHLTDLGRVSGYMREFITSLPQGELSHGSVVAAASVVHLFTNESAVANWITEVFLKRFNERVGKTISPGQQLLSVDNLEMGKFHDLAAGIRAVQQGTFGVVSSRIIDFRIGRLLGVASTVTLGDGSRDSYTRSLAVDMERHIVKVILGSS